jgi:hypothetical protein
MTPHITTPSPATTADPFDTLVLVVGAWARGDETREAVEDAAAALVANRASDIAQRAVAVIAREARLRTLRDARDAIGMVGLGHAGPYRLSAFDAIDALIEESSP